MTCIVGAAHGGQVWIGGDSWGIGGGMKHHREDPKVFTLGEFGFGFTTSFRMGDILRYHFSAPSRPEACDDDREYLVKYVIPHIRKILSDNGWMKKDSDREEGGTFLLGYRGTLYEVYDDLQVAQPTEQRAAVGCGFKYALGAMAVLADMHPDPGDLVRDAIRVAALYDPWVGGEIRVVSVGDAPETP